MIETDFDRQAWRISEGETKNANGGVALPRPTSDPASSRTGDGTNVQRLSLPRQKPRRRSSDHVLATYLIRYMYLTEPVLHLPLNF
jgi:hypothetical protein